MGFGDIKAVGRVPFLLGIAVSIICFLSINDAMRPFSTNTYCGTTCHEMDAAYRSWELSVQGVNSKGMQIDCVQCHLPPKEDYFTHLFAKAWAGGRDMYMHHFDPEYNEDEVRHKASEKMSNETCAYCHEDLLASTGCNTQSAAAFLHLGHFARSRADAIALLERLSTG